MTEITCKQKYKKKPIKFIWSGEGVKFGNELTNYFPLGQHGAVH